MAMEQEVLTMEFNTLQEANDRLQLERNELQKTLDEMMNSFQNVVDGNNIRNCVVINLKSCLISVLSCCS